MERLERLEEQNKLLLTEVRALREELSGKKTAEALPPMAPVTERVEVLEQRSAEHEQSKVEAEHRLPVQLSGMVLFNAFVNGKNAGGAQMPVVASTAADPSPVGGGTFRQSLVGFKFQGPRIFAGGDVSGSLTMDLFAGSGVPLNQALRLRVATLDLNWTNTTLSFAHDKPLMSPREPVSLAQMGVSPLTAAGNLWFWQPQIRVEQRFHFGGNTGLRALLGVIQTSETSVPVPTEFQASLAGTRPGLEGRFELWHKAGNARIEIAPGFHVSNTHVAGQSVPSRVYSVDWLLRPFSRIDLTGQYFYNQNSNILGGLRPGLLFLPNGVVRPVTGSAEWAQLTIRATSRGTFNFYGGQASNHLTDIRTVGTILSNRTWAGNIIYKLGTNVLASFEVYQARTQYLGIGRRLVPHYDLALAYLF